MNVFLDEIYRWFKLNKRDLPWRETSDPYRIWLSEIILQQTRVAQGTQYYQRFIENFPTVFELAYASEDQVLKLWQGLGYYTRARNIYFTAKKIVNVYNGEFPNKYDEILKLKGIGPYTAAAIASIAFGLPHATVDGNVYRVLSRYFGIKTPIDSTNGKKEFNELAESLILSSDPGMHNQALMEFGALQCIPKSPNCNLCPLAKTCFAFHHKLVNELPLKSKKTKQRNRYFYYYYIESGDFTFIEKRNGNDIWKNLYQFPLVETQKEYTETDLISLKIPLIEKIPGNIKLISTTKKHILSHQIIYAKVIQIELNDTNFRTDKFIRINKKDISKFAVPKLLEQFIEELKVE